VAIQTAGRRGARGATGKTGLTGAKGATGARGALASKEYILSAVADQFEEVRKQLDQQLIRTGQIQAELDRQRHDTVEVRQQLKVIQALLKKSLNDLAVSVPARDQPDKT
jgi:flagellar motility protein MotE (MotC chaperone)